MLAKTDEFLSAVDLRLYPDQRKYLIQTLELLESGRLKSDKFTEIDDTPLMFDIGEWYDPEYLMDDHQCGTVACIGGTACFLAGGNVSLFDTFPSTYPLVALNNLFHHWGGGPVTPKQAAKQLRDYLMTGKCEMNWNLPENRR